MKILRKKKLSSGKVCILIESRTQAMSEAEGKHYIVTIPVDLQKPDGKGYLRRNLNELERAQAYLFAEACGMSHSMKLGRRGYYRIEINGPNASSQKHLHFHVIVGKVGFTFRRSVDSIKKIELEKNAA